MKEQILKSKAIGKEDGIELESEYRFSLYKSRYGGLSIRPEQSFKGEFNEFSKLPGWSLKSLKNRPVDELMIDMGQKWSVSGLLKAIEEAEKIAEMIEVDKSIDNILEWVASC